MTETMPCPYCARSIRVGAVICRYCREDLPSERVTFRSSVEAQTSNAERSPLNTLQQPTQFPDQSRGARRFLVGGVVLLLLISCYLLYPEIESGLTAWGPDDSTGVSNTPSASADYDKSSSDTVAAAGGQREVEPQYDRQRGCNTLRELHDTFMGQARSALNSGDMNTYERASTLASQAQDKFIESGCQ